MSLADDEPLPPSRASMDLAAGFGSRGSTPMQASPGTTMRTLQSDLGRVDLGAGEQDIL